MINHPPFFSVIIPTFNRRKEVITAIQSVVDQNFRSFEILLVDDGSTDDTIARIREKFPDSRIKLHSLKHSGRSAARNFGIQHATGKWICFLDSDDHYLPELLEKFHEKIQENPQYAAFACRKTINHQQHDIASNQNQRVLRLQDFLMDNPLVLTQVCYKNDLYFRFPDGLEYAEDWYFFRHLSHNTGILMLDFVGINLCDHPERSIYTIGSENFAADNYKSASLTVKELPLTDEEKDQLMIYTNLLCTNIILSGSRNKKEAFLYFRQCLNWKALLFLNFYKAIVKFIVL